MKIQSGKIASLTDAEKAAVAPLRKDGRLDGVEGDIDDAGINVTEGAAQVPLDALQIAYEKQITKKRKARDDDKYGEYRNCDFMLESGAEIERVWSSVEKVLSPARFSTHPILLEAILFLRFNQKYWTLFTVSQAIKSVRNEESSKRYKKEAGRFGVLDMHYD
jgi:hypothetical protein